MTASKPTVSIRDVSAINIGDRVSGTIASEHTHGEFPFMEGDRVSTSSVVAVSDDGKTFETRNTIYKVVE